MYTYKQRLEEIRYAVENKEVHRATSSLMDFIRDFFENDPVLDDAVKIRKQYNSLRELGKSDIPENDAREILGKARQILDLIGTYPLEQRQEELLQRYPRHEVLAAYSIEKEYVVKGSFHLGPVSTVLKAGEITGIVGENGNGKTTLLRILARLLDFNSGNLTYFFDGQEVEENYSIKNQIAYIPQRLERWQGTLRENLHFAAATHGIYGSDNDKAVEFVIHRMGLSSFAHLGWSELSSGYKLRFELAKMLVWSPKILILDEPLANLDINAQQWLLQDFRHIAGSLRNPVSIILSSQQLHEVENVADNIIFLRNGKCDYSGRTKEFMTDRQVNTYEIGGDFTVPALQEKFAGKGYSFSENGASVTVRTAIEVTSADLLKDFLHAGYNIKYFRDISTSTKQLFQL